MAGAVQFPYAAQLRLELAIRNRVYAREFPHVESCDRNPVMVYAPENGHHGNFHAPAYAAISARPEWMRRFEKVHAQGRSLPKPQIDPARRWRELDSCMSSDALLMNVFCTPEVADSLTLRRIMGIDDTSGPTFGWRAQVPLKNGRLDRTEVDMRWGSLIVEAKLTESDFQCRETTIVESYRDFEDVFDTSLLPRALIRTRRRRAAVELVEEFTQEWEPPSDEAGEVARSFHAVIEACADAQQPWEPGYAGYQLIRNVLAASATNSSFCVIHDQRRPDLREAWFEVMRAARRAETRVRCKVLTWQELVPFLPDELCRFLDLKYGIVAPGCVASSIDGMETLLG